MNIAVIPARGGSKRIPGKNIKEFCGKPIIAYSIEAACETGLFERIVVSTDSQEIAEIAKRYGAECPFLRPSELADDMTPMGVSVAHCLERLSIAANEENHFCCLLPTAPLIRAADVVGAYEVLVKQRAHSVMAVTSYEYPVFRSLEADDNGHLKWCWPEHAGVRSQDLPEVYHDAGQFYWARLSDFLQTKVFIAARALPYSIPRHIVQDIDTSEDWKRAELLFRAIHADPGMEP